MDFEQVTRSTLITFLIDFIDQNNVLPADERLLEFLEKFWDIDNLPSDDPRFTESRGNVWQHMINNDDWTSRELLTSKLKLSKLNDEQLISFIKEIFPFISREAAADFIARLSIFLDGYFTIEQSENRILQRSEIRLNSVDNVIFTPLRISENKLPIYLKSQAIKIEAFPCFTLIYDNWNDYGYTTMCDIAYHLSDHEQVKLFKIKIMKKDVSKTWDVLENMFYDLSDDFCSLGQNIEYYIKLKSNLKPELFKNFLYAMKDVAFFPAIHEKFIDDEIFNASLIRENDVERLLRSAKFEITGGDIADYYQFKYCYKPPYTESSLDISFNFDVKGSINNRVIALIGKNGSGKTQLLSQLTNDIHQNNLDKFHGRKLIFSKIFTISYSIFDRFKIPSPNAEFNYVYCGLKKSDNIFLSQEEIDLNIKLSLMKLNSRIDLKGKWYKILLIFIDKELLDLIITHTEFLEETNDFLEDGWNDFFARLSSGQSILLNVMSKLLSEIRFDSLIMFDEPETHLHPNAISELISIIFDIVEQFESFCILSTHSPIIIQQMRAENILILERDGAICNISSPSNDTFGENLTTITEDVFGANNIPKYFLEKIKNLISRGLSLNDIKNQLKSNDLNLSLNSELYINALYKKNHEKS